MNISPSLFFSALEIERVLLEHPDVSDCAVVGVPDDVWGEKVSAVMATETPENVSHSIMSVIEG